MGVPCSRCGRSYDVSLFAFGRTLCCCCGERVALAPRRVGPRVGSELRFSADAMLGRLARWLRVAGYDTRYDPHIEDTDLVRGALEEGRIILTRDRALPVEWSVADVLVLRSERTLEQLREVGRRFPLDWRRRAFSRCSRCNARLERVAREAVADRLPERVRLRSHALMRCPVCDRVYWEGSHTDRMRRVLARCLDAEAETQAGPGSTGPSRT